jgi:hypothetical protein
MRIDLTPIVDSGRMLLDAIERRDADAARSIAGTCLDALPPDDFADPAPGLTICFGMDEYGFAKTLPYLRGAVRKWRGWLEAPAGEWPEPRQLRECLRHVETIRTRHEPAAVADPVK